MASVETADGFRLWYEVVGEDGPAIVLPTRVRGEQGKLAAALSSGRRVVRYKPRQVVGVLEPEDEAGGEFDPTSFTRFPAETEISDLHAVADAAGISEFVLGGYSGMGALAGFLAPLTERAVGLMVGGFPLLSGGEYWLGYVEGARAGLLTAGMPEKAAEHWLGVLMYREWLGRDDTEALAKKPGPKITWYGTGDGEPGCRMYDLVGGSAIARRTRADTARLEELGFTVLAFDGLDHIGGLAATDVVGPRLDAALSSAGW
ncbi:alpha/beta fold hydrolase [Actinomadura logoneensis]|uniref:alpha/beta fold hydrolase n=1 Tax=Actinomadura logoneensis TaxID=2293572 RepID=UPI0011C13455|nr:alpha/beta hydrolase [Actinomadura logoneensis]